MQLSLPRHRDRSQASGTMVEERVGSKSRAIAKSRPATDPFVEEFRLLGMNIVAMLGDTPRRAITVFSHDQDVGRTRIAVELSRALAAQNDVLLIDGQRNSTGNHESLLIKAPAYVGRQPNVSERLIPTDHRRLWLSDPSQAVESHEQLKLRLSEAAAAGMVIVVDAPASKSTSDAFMIAQSSHNVLYVMRNKPQDMAPHVRAMDHLRRLDVRILGIVLNDR